MPLHTRLASTGARPPKLALAAGGRRGTGIEAPPRRNSGPSPGCSDASFFVSGPLAGPTPSHNPGLATVSGPKFKEEGFHHNSLLQSAQPDVWLCHGLSFNLRFRIKSLMPGAAKGTHGPGALGLQVLCSQRP